MKKDQREKGGSVGPSRTKRPSHWAICRHGGRGNDKYDHIPQFKNRSIKERSPLSPEKRAVQKKAVSQTRRESDQEAQDGTNEALLIRAGRKGVPSQQRCREKKCSTTRD